MSHFTVLVITDSADQLEAALAPFQENNTGNCPAEYMTFNDRTEEVTKGWEEEFAKDRYESIDEYAKDYHGYGPHIDDTTGETMYGYFENPNRKWDWWVLGGRWRGFFKLKNGVNGVVGEAGVFGNPAIPGYADQAMKKDIDFDGMVNDAVEEAKATFVKVRSAIAGLEGTPKIWKTFLREMDEGKIVDIEEARKLYHEQPHVRALQSARELRCFMGCEIETYHLHEEASEQKYINDCRCDAFSTYAVVYQGDWYQKGEMGWFGISMDEKSNYDWGAQFMDIIDQLPDDAVLSLVDCHI